ncbi:MAG: aquaporin [Aquiluna sp.]|nr:aquaporin [Aquiluna sp.]
MAHTLNQKLFAEFLGTAGIVTAVTGAGFMATNLGADNTTALMIIAIAAGAVLFGGISILAPISGAHFNPAVTVVLGLMKKISARDGVAYVVAQLLGGFSGAVAANLMFGSAWVSANSTSRASAGNLLGESIATFGLVLLVLLLIQHNQTQLIAAGVGTWILAAHFFTSSTSFANPAVTFGRAFTDAITGIDLASLLPFIGVQLIGGLVALGALRLLAVKSE